jgi:hypothetical protein
MTPNKYTCGTVLAILEFDKILDHFKDLQVEAADFFFFFPFSSSLRKVENIYNKVKKVAFNLVFEQRILWKTKNK